MMRRLWFLMGLLAAVAGSSWARFPPHGGSAPAPPPPPGGTVFVSGTCSANIAITNGGLTVTGAPTSVNKFCQANNGKFSGRYYFTFTPIAVPSGPSYGVSPAGFRGSPDMTLNGQSLALTPVGLGYGGGSVTSYSVAIVPTVSNPTQSVVAAIAINMETDPYQVWVTPDVTGTSGYASGPLWNNSSASSPEVPGTGSVVTSGGTGGGFYLIGANVYPTYQAFNADAATFNFDAETHVEAAIGSAKSVVYLPWNADVGGSPTPGPLNPLVFNVANAPVWTAGATIAAGSRVTAGPGWNGSAYVQGQPIYLWALAGSGGTTGGSQPAGLSSCPSPANVGGGLDGSTPAGWSGATSVTDNGLTWKCLAVVDYVTMSDAAADDVPWAPTSQFAYFGYVLNAGHVYINTDESVDPCITASGGGPTSTAGGVITDGTCGWRYQQDFTYSSRRQRVGHQVYTGLGGWESQYSYEIHYVVWYGGVAKPVYQAGVAGEADNIAIANHQDLAGDGTVWCHHAYGVLMAKYGCLAYPEFMIPIYIEPATGDAWNQNVTASAGPIRVDPTKGVTFKSTLTGTGSGPGAAIGISDSGLTLRNLQLWSTQWSAVDGWGFNIGPQHQCCPGGERFINVIAQADGGSGVIALDFATAYINSVIIYNGTAADSWGVAGKFISLLFNTTFLGPGGGVSNSSAIAQWERTVHNFYMENTASFGFTNPYAAGDGSQTVFAFNNATDVTSVSGTPFAMSGIGLTVTPFTLPGTSGLTGLTTSNQFVNPAIGGSLDLRVKNTSAGIYGAGAASTWGGPVGASTWIDLNWLATDVFGNPRPTSGRYDIGAEQYTP